MVDGAQVNTIKKVVVIKRNYDFSSVLNKMSNVSLPVAGTNVMSPVNMA